MRNKYTKEQLEEAVKTSWSIAGVLFKLNMRPCGGNYLTLKQKFIDWNIDTLHFTGKAWNQGERYRKIKEPAPLVEVLIKDSNKYNLCSHNLKNRLIKEGLKQARCEKCLLSEWLGKPIAIELDHINGERTDNRLCNLRILCPNCHAQTPRYRGKHKNTPLVIQQIEISPSKRKAVGANPTEGASLG